MSGPSSSSATTTKASSSASAAKKYKFDSIGANDMTTVGGELARAALLAGEYVFVVVVIPHYSFYIHFQCERKCVVHKCHFRKIEFNVAGQCVGKNEGMD
jgi:hypothetical protein